MFRYPSSLVNIERKTKATKWRVRKICGVTGLQEREMYRNTGLNRAIYLAIPLSWSFELFRPVTLRPCLSAGLPFTDCLSVAVNI
jgi:hypothetical protein